MRKHFLPKPDPEVSIQWSSSIQRPFNWGLGSPPYSDAVSPEDPVLHFVDYSENSLNSRFSHPQAPRPDGSNAVFVTEIGTDIVFTAIYRFAETGCSPVFWEWNFGDGIRGYGVEVTHSYALPAPQGIQVVLTVTDTKGRKWRAREQVYVQERSITPVLISSDKLLIPSGAS